jgi:hypothetical protein
VRVPVTARLSKLFYERLGEQIANELVDWFNQVDATYRSDLKDLNEINFARFDAKVEQRMAALESKLEQRMVALESSIEKRISALEHKVDVGFSEIREYVQARVAEQTRFFFLAWGILLASNIALWFK